MTEPSSTGGRLFIEVVNWERFQGRSASTGQPWFAIYTDLFDDPDFLALTAPDRCLFFGILCDTKRLGNGRVSGNITALRSRHNIRRASLEPLIQAGWITLVGTRREHDARTRRALQDKTGQEEPSKVLPSPVVVEKGSPAAPDGAGSPPNGQLRKPSPTELDDDLRPLQPEDDSRDTSGYLY